MTEAVVVRAASPADLPQMIALHDRVFGPGALTRTAYRVREGAPQLSAFCMIAARGDEIIASVRFTEITIGGTSGALLLGPLAVAPEYAGQGYGRKLVADGLAAAKERGLHLVVLVGDEPYYARLGFHIVPQGQITMPGPVDPRRLLAAELSDGALARYRGQISSTR